MAGGNNPIQDIVTTSTVTPQTVQTDFENLISGLSGEVTDITRLIKWLDDGGVSMVQNRSAPDANLNVTGIVWMDEPSWVSQLKSYRDGRLPEDVRRAKIARDDTASLVQSNAAAALAVQNNFVIPIAAAAGTNDTLPILSLISAGQGAPALKAQNDHFLTTLTQLYAAAGFTDVNTPPATVAAAIAKAMNPSTIAVLPGPVATAPMMSYGTILAGIAGLAAVGGGIWWYTAHKKKNGAGPHSRLTVPSRAHAHMSMEATEVAEVAAPPARPPMFPPMARANPVRSNPVQPPQSNPRRRSSGSARAHARLLPSGR